MSEHITEAERQVLGAILTSPAALDDVAGVLTAHDFADARHGTIYDTALTLAAASKPHDVPAVADALGTDRDRIGGIEALFNLTGRLITAANVEHHASIVREASIRRQVRAIANELAAHADHQDGTPALDLLNTARTRLDTLATQDVDDIPNHLAVWQAIEALDAPRGLPTPWTDLTRALGGWRPEALYIIGARTSVGKSVVALNALLDVARRGQRALLFSLEMSRDEVYHRLLSNIAGIDGMRIQRNELTPENRADLASAARSLEPLPLVIDDRANLSVAQIRARIKTEQRKGQVGIVIVDYLGKVKPPSGTPKNDRRVQVDAIAWAHKEMARELHVPVVAMSQLNRGIEHRAEKMPMLSDLRESGGQEQDADVVILLHRALTEDHGDPSELHMWVAKNRHGIQPRLSLNFIGHHSRITEDPRPWRPSLPTAPNPAHWADDRED